MLGLERLSYDISVRIIGTLKRHECRKLREAYDRLGLSKTTLEAHFKSALAKGQHVYCSYIVLS